MQQSVGVWRSKMEIVEMTFRAATKADCPRIAELFKISSDGVVEYIWDGLKSEYPGLSPIEIGTRRYESEEGNVSYRNCVLGELDGEVVAQLCTFPIPPEPDPDYEPSDPVLEPYERLEEPGSLYISSLAVLDEHRGRGIGHRMLDIARDQARERGFDTLSLLVFEQNEGAVRLYEREGFQTTGRAVVVPHEKIHYTGDVLLMVTPISK